jgi:hypothetical protein
MLAGFAVSDHESVRTLAVGFAARMLFFGFRDCEFLLTVAADSNGVLVRADAPRSDAEVVSAVLALNVIANLCGVDVRAGFVGCLRNIASR